MDMGFPGLFIPKGKAVSASGIGIIHPGQFLPAFLIRQHPAGNRFLSQRRQMFRRRFPLPLVHEETEAHGQVIGSCRGHEGYKGLPLLRRQMEGASEQLWRIPPPPGSRVGGYAYNIIGVKSLAPHAHPVGTAVKVTGSLPLLLPQEHRLRRIELLEIPLEERVRRLFKTVGPKGFHFFCVGSRSFSDFHGYLLGAASRPCALRA